MSTIIEGPTDKHSDSGVVAAPHDSEEYESAEEIYDDDEEVEEIEVEIEEEEEEDADETKEKELDDDEDRQNPQFIPKKGYFYEHDDRTKTEDETEEPEKEVKEEKPKKVVKEVDRWAHDCFDEHEQGQKSNEELVKIYGYNIREEDQPPKAVRRRRYGRGPKKYTRKSEDGEAYQKPRGGYSGRGRRGGGRNFRDNEGAAGGYDEEFPQLKTNNNSDRSQAPSSEVNDRSGGSAAKSHENRDQNRGRGGGRPRQNRPRDSDNRERDNRHSDGFEENRNQSYNNDSSRGRRGTGNNGGRRHRHEFTNRNRYAENRFDSSSNQNVSYNSGSNFTRKNEQHSKDVDFNSRREKPWEEYDTPTRGVGTKVTSETKTSPLTSRSSENTVTEKSLPSLQKGLPAKTVTTLPFTNTEYTGSASLTAGNKSNVSNSSGGSGNDGSSEPQNRQHQQDYEQNSRNRNVGRVEGTGELERNVEPPRIDTRIDSRDALNTSSSRPTLRSVPKSYNANERRPQIPLRLQQQQQQQQQRHEVQQQRHENLQQQQQQAQLDQTNLSAGKPKRFSTQRQRQVVDTSSLQQTSMPSQMIPQVVPVQQPVATVAGSMVTSPVPSYPPQTYYDTAPPNFDTQVYETAGNSMAGNGPASVSPNLWGGPHAAAYATTGAPVQPAVQFADPSAFIAATQPSGPPIFAAPPHPQFIQDAAMLNFANAPTPPFAPPYQGYQGYAQVTPAPPPPEVYHAGVTYYNTQNQIQRPPVMTVQKRPKTEFKEIIENSLKAPESDGYHSGSGVTYYNVGDQMKKKLQLVEPPEKSKNKDNQMQQQQLEGRRDDSESNPLSPTTDTTNSEFVQLNNNADTDEDLSRKLEHLSTQEVEAPETSDLGTEAESWSSQMDQMSPTETVPPQSTIIPHPVVASTPPLVEIEAKGVATDNVSPVKPNDFIEMRNAEDSSNSSPVHISEIEKSQDIKMPDVELQSENTNDNVQESVSSGEQLADPPSPSSSSSPTISQETLTKESASSSDTNS